MFTAYSAPCVLCLPACDLYVLICLIAFSTVCLFADDHCLLACLLPRCALLVPVVCWDVWWDHREVGDAGMVQLTRLRLLETLSVFSASITDFGVAHGLCRLPSLTSLEVSSGAREGGREEGGGGRGGEGTGGDRRETEK